MSVSEILRKLGSWEIRLKPTIDRQTLDALQYFGHVVIVPGRDIPVSQYGDQLLAIARYVGVVRTRTWGDDGRTNAPLDDLSVGGPGMAMWLGDEDGKGDVLENAVEAASASFAATVNMLLPASGAMVPGTIYPVAGLYSGRHIYETKREALDYLCDTMSTESVPVSWRANGTGTVDAGPEADLFVTDPRCVIMARGPGEDMSMRALEGSTDVTRDAEDFTTRVLLLAEGEGASIATGSADINPGLNPYKDIRGNTLRMTRLVSESDTASGNAATRAQLQLNRFASIRNALTLSTADYDIQGTFRVGDRVWVYDPDAGLVDTANEIIFRGQRLNPMKLKVTETSWSVTEDYTVAYRDANGVWYDLSDHVEFETDGTANVTVGDFNRQLTGASQEPIGSRPSQDTSTPGIPTLIEPFVGSAYLDARGFTRARVILAWNAPLNVDGSTILDGDHYEIRYAVDTDMIYPATWGQISQVRWMDLQTWAQPFASPDGRWQIAYAPWGDTTFQLQDLSPGIGYDVQIRAVDKTGNTGAWGPVTTFVASTDNMPPSAPAAPEVAGSRIALQITHQLGKSSGGTFNLESDLHHLEIHVDYEPHFTPSADTVKAKVSATAGMIQAQIPVVATVQVEETSARYVRVVAVDITGNKSGPSDAAAATALLIDDAHISDLTVSKVTAGTITADWFIGARIKTADTGPRVELNSSGLQAYSASGAQTVDIASATGDVTILGQIISGTTGRRLEINPTATRLPEIRFYASSGPNYGYVNSTSSGANADLGVNSGPFDDGTGTMVYGRLFLTDPVAELAVVRDDTQTRRGGFSRAYYDSFWAGFNRDSTNGGIFIATETSAFIGWDDGGANLNRFNFTSDGITRHIGKWRNFVSAASNEGIITGTVLFGTATSASIGYGPTMDSQVVPIVTCVSGNFGSATPTVWGIQSFTLTGFTVAWNNSQGMRLNYWAFRT
ncbi:hypothetical protein [Streptomyces sp. NPDC096153]|uniref:hypothetical protein n=1 Tax=Streptomyces sp. NPDC096153 TaxID=3155548 RepID=UPI003322350A